MKEQTDGRERERTVCMRSFPLFSLVLLSNPNELMTISVWKRNKFSHFSTLSYKVVCWIHEEHMEFGCANGRECEGWLKREKLVKC